MGFRRTTTAEEKERRSSSGGREEEGCCGSTSFSLMAATPGSNDNNNNNNKDSSNNHQIQFQHQAELLLQQQISYHGMMQSPPQPQQQQQSNHGNFMCSSRVSNKGEDQLNTTTTTTSAGGGGGGGGATSAYDFGELDQALFMYLDQQGHDHHHHHHTSSAAHQDQQRQNSSSAGIRPPTLNIFPSQPMHVEPSSRTCAGLVSLKSGSGSKRPSELAASMELTNLVPSRNNQDLHVAASSGPHHHHEPAKSVKREGNRKGLTTSSSEHEGPKTPDPKTLRRLAQNREAARKSRLRKKAYVQQLESSRIKLTQLEQELQRARSQGLFLGGGGGAGMLGDQGLPLGMSHITSEAAVFDMEYSRWLEEHHRLMCELQAAVQEHLPENELRLFVDNCLAHYDEMIGLKSMAVKTDVFHLVSGMWKTPAERCFMWMGGFRPSELIKVLLNQIEPLTEQQILGICGLQQSTQEAEEALTQGLDALHQSLSDTIASDALTYPSNMTNYMGQMAIAMNKLSTLEGFVRQADNLRHQTLHRLHQVLTTRQAARCFLAIAEYFHRLRALSSLWLSRPRQDQ